MKIKVNEIKSIGEGLNEILEIALPIKTAYWLARLVNKLDSELKAFERVRMNLVTQHAKKDKEGKPLFKKDKDGKDTNEVVVVDMEKFQKEFIELAEEDLDIDFKPIKLADLGDIKIKPIILAKLGKIIEE
jgi:hypothetical protein